jgi:hypothetical protein
MKKPPMKKPILLTPILLFLFLTDLAAQPPCAFDHLHRSLLQKDSNYARRIEENKIAIRKFIEGTHKEMELLHGLMLHIRYQW